MVFRVIQLAKPIGQFTASDEEFKAVGQEGVVVVATRQGADLGRIQGDKGRLEQLVFDRLFENFDLNLAQSVAVFNRHTQFFSVGGCLSSITQRLRTQLWVLFQNRVKHADTTERLT